MKKLRERITKLIHSPDYEPLNKSEFARNLSVKPNERATLRAELLRLEGKGDIVRGKKGRFNPRSNAGKKSPVKSETPKSQSPKQGEKSLEKPERRPGRRSRWL